jgi:hypothetical protein
MRSPLLKHVTVSKSGVSNWNSQLMLTFSGLKLYESLVSVPTFRVPS